MNEFNNLYEEIKCCKGCSLCETRTNVVFGQGVPESRILLVGEAPGENEDKTGIPFVGRGGQLMESMLNTAGFYRDKNYYITNILKCRPPKNRDPRPDEVAACRKYLERQIEIIDPAIIVCIGRIAACTLIKPDFKVTKEHGELFKIDGRLYMGTFHPAALLRNPNNKPAAQDDFNKLAELVKEN